MQVREKAAFDPLDAWNSHGRKAMQDGRGSEEGN